MAEPSGRRRWPGGRIALASALVALLAVSIVLPAASVAAPARAPVAVARPYADPAITARVTWNGADVANYSAPTAAASISFGQTVDVHYTWSSSALAGAPMYEITDARLQIYYFGFALATRDILDSVAVPATSGSFDMNWSTGSLQYILEGSYELTASLLASNGTTMFSESFWVLVAAPFYVGALLPIVLILIIIYEIYGIATVGKQAALGRPSKGPAEAPAPAEPAPAPEEAPPPTDVSPPPTGGP